jgi:hypothetical protein
LEVSNIGLNTIQGGKMSVSDSEVTSDVFSELLAALFSNFQLQAIPNGYVQNESEISGQTETQTPIASNLSFNKTDLAELLNGLKLGSGIAPSSELNGFMEEIFQAINGGESLEEALDMLTEGSKVKTSSIKSLDAFIKELAGDSKLVKDDTSIINGEDKKGVVKSTVMSLKDFTKSNVSKVQEKASTEISFDHPKDKLLVVAAKMKKLNIQIRTRQLRT